VGTVSGSRPIRACPNIGLVARMPILLAWMMLSRPNLPIASKVAKPSPPNPGCQQALATGERAFYSWLAGANRIVGQRVWVWIPGPVPST